MNDNNILEIRGDRHKDKREVLILFIVLNLITIWLAWSSVECFLIFCGSYAVICGIAFLISRARKDEFMTLDTQGIKVKNRETPWEDTSRCYFDYIGKNSMALIVELKDGQMVYYPMRWMRYNKYEVAQYVNKLSGRELFDYSTTAKNIAGQLSFAGSCLLVFISFVIVILVRPHYVAATTVLLIATVEFAITYFMGKKIIREYIEYKFEKALGKAVF